MANEVSDASPITAEDAWQKRLLPFMTSMLAALIIFFCAAIAWETYHIQTNVETAHEIDLRTPANREFSSNPGFLLEANLIERRYHQTSAAMVSRIYLIFLGFATGMVLAMVGATFVLGKMREGDTSIDGEGGSVKASMKSGSPGLILAAFGTTLMLTTILSRADITVTDQAVYLGPSSANAAEHSGDTAVAKSQTPSKEAPEHPGQPALAKSEVPAYAGLHAAMAGLPEIDGDYALDSGVTGRLSIRGAAATFRASDGKAAPVDWKTSKDHILFTIHKSERDWEEFDGYPTSDGDIAGTHTAHGSFTTSPAGFVAKKLRHR